MTRRLVIIGGGTAGLAVANQLRRRLRSDEIILVSTQSYMTYQPLLPEVAGHTVPAAHVVVPLRRAAPGVRVIVASMTDLDVDAQTVGLAASDGSRQTLVYDELVLALGSVARTFPIPGLTEHSVGFRTVEEAQHVGSRVLEKLELAAGTNDPDVRRRASTFVFVGGGHSGVEALAELEDMGRRYLERQGLQGTVRPLWVLVEAGDRILGAMPDRLGTYVDRHLTKRGVDIRWRSAMGPR
jgi:NADH dehydrogenase